MRSGKRGESGTSPKIPTRCWLQSSCSVLPANGPFATTLWASGRSTISQDSPIRLFEGKFLPKNSASLRPPQIRSMKIGLNSSGGLGLGISPYIKHQTTNIKHLFSIAPRSHGSAAKRKARKPFDNYLAGQLVGQHVRLPDIRWLR